MECLRPVLKKRKRYSRDDPKGVVGGFTTPVTPAGPPSDAGDSVPGITPKSVTFPRGSKCQRIVGSADPKIDRTPIDLPCHCDGCGKYILTARHNCDVCEDYDLCAPCYASLVDGALAHEHDASCFEVKDWTEEEEEEAALEEASRSTAAHATPASDGTGGARPDDRGDGDGVETPGGGGRDGVGAVLFQTPTSQAPAIGDGGAQPAEGGGSVADANASSSR